MPRMNTVTDPHTGSFAGATPTTPTVPAPAAPAHDRLLVIAMRYCDAINASDKAREDWREDVRNTPQHLRQGLGEYLRDQLRQPHLLWRTP